MVTSFPIFIPKTDRLAKLSQKFPHVITKLETVFNKPTIVYIDFANVIPWSNKLKWNVDIKRLKQLLDSFSNIKKVRFYYGELKDDARSKMILSEAKKNSYDLNTKPVKIIRQSINVSSINMQSPDLLRQFISRQFLTKLSIQDIEYFNNRLKDLNNSGTFELLDKKCNFDVEIRGHMADDLKNKNIYNYALWSGDCDFEEPIIKIVNSGKKFVVFGTRGAIARELANSGAYIYEVYSLKYFICFSKQIGFDI
ncbi:MAG: NYN domain-containing protein [Candidatus Woesebacteria bacterium]|nr:NYN domain-containing protein [Candidatus Woesebacteria bacterium]